MRFREVDDYSQVKNKLGERVKGFVSGRLVNPFGPKEIDRVLLMSLKSGQFAKLIVSIMSSSSEELSLFMSHSGLWLKLSAHPPILQPSLVVYCWSYQQTVKEKTEIGIGWRERQRREREPHKCLYLTHFETVPGEWKCVCLLITSWLVLVAIRSSHHCPHQWDCSPHTDNMGHN